MAEKRSMQLLLYRNIHEPTGASAHVEILRGDSRQKIDLTALLKETGGPVNVRVEDEDPSSLGEAMQMHFVAVETIQLNGMGDIGTMAKTLTAELNRGGDAGKALLKAVEDFKCNDRYEQYPRANRNLLKGSLISALQSVHDVAPDFQKQEQQQQQQLDSSRVAHLTDDGPSVPYSTERKDFQHTVGVAAKITSLIADGKQSLAKAFGLRPRTEQLEQESSTASNANDQSRSTAAGGGESARTRRGTNRDQFI